MIYEWVNLFEIAKVSGFVYFNVYVNSVTNKAIGWVTRTGLEEPYGYSCYFAGPTEVIDSRGTFRHALECIEGLANDAAAGAGVPQAIVERIAKYGWTVEKDPAKWFVVRGPQPQRLMIACAKTLVGALALANPVNS